MNTRSTKTLTSFYSVGLYHVLEEKLFSNNLSWYSLVSVSCCNVAESTDCTDVNWRKATGPRHTVFTTIHSKMGNQHWTTVPEDGSDRVAAGTNGNTTGVTTGQIIRGNPTLLLYKKEHSTEHTLQEVKGLHKQEADRHCSPFRKFEKKYLSDTFC
jgi:hypothetical protein